MADFDGGDQAEHLLAIYHTRSPAYQRFVYNMTTLMHDIPLILGMELVSLGRKRPISYHERMQVVGTKQTSSP